MQTFSLHKIYDDQHIPFDPTSYSKFKFGSKEVAREFGTALADAFAWEFILPRKLTDNLVIASSPYCFIPTATFALKDYFIRQLNEWLVQAGYNVVQETKIYRTITYKEDYGELSAEQRLSLIQNDGFYMDTQFIKDKQVLLLDDIKITGSHERVIERMFTQLDVSPDRIYIYFAELCNTLIHPKIENYLNYAYVHSLLDLDKIIKNNEFILNTRIIKYILSSNFIDFMPFINYQSIELVRSIYHLAKGNSYHLIPEYAENLSYIQKLIY